MAGNPVIKKAAELIINYVCSALASYVCFENMLSVNDSLCVFFIISGLISLVILIILSMTKETKNRLKKRIKTYGILVSVTALAIFFCRLYLSFNHDGQYEVRGFNLTPEAKLYTENHGTYSPEDLFKKFHGDVHFVWSDVYIYKTIFWVLFIALIIFLSLFIYTMLTLKKDWVKQKMKWLPV